MKTAKKTAIKITSSILCCSLIMQLGLNLTKIDINAASTLGVSNGVVTLTADSSSSDVSITADGDGYKISSEDFADETVSEISKIVIDGPVNLHIRADLETSLEMGAAASQVFIDSGYTVKWNGFSAVGGTLYNEGTMEFSEFILTDILGYTEDSYFSISNSGTIKASVIDFYHQPFGFSSSSSAKYIASTSFSHGSFTLDGTVIANRSTEISNLDYGTFTLEVEGATQTVSTEIESQPAYTLFKDPGVDFISDTVPTIYVGQTHEDFKTYFYTLQGYNGEIYVEYKGFSEDDSAYTTEEPTAAGTYYIRATAPSDGPYLESHSSAKEFKIKYLDVSQQFPDGNYFTFGNLVNGIYVNGQVKVVPISSDYQISFAGSDFADYAMVSEEDVLLDGEIPFPYVMFKLKDKNTGAETDNLYVSNTMSANFEDLVFDSSNPVFFAAVYNSEGEDREISLNQDLITGAKLEIVVRDDNLGSVTLTVDDTETNETIVENQCRIVLNSIADKAQQIKITATDLAGRVSEAEFKFSPETTISLSVPETIYAGDDYEIGITTNNTDGEVSIEYMRIEDEEPVEGQPKTAGDYVAFVTIAATDTYKAAESSIEFSIIKRTPSITFSVPSIYVGGTVSPILTTDSDGKDDATYVYKVKGADDSTYSSTVPTAVGEYTAKVTVPATVKYDESSDTADFKIEKKQVAATVSVDGSYVGEEYSVDIQVTSTDYEVNTDEYTIEYKLSSAEGDDAFTGDKPEAAGEYTVRVTLPETDYYLETVIESTFTIYKQEYLGSISAADIYVGDPVNVSIYNTLMDRDDLIYKYKLVTEPDSAFSTVEPQAAGTYRVRVTAPENYYFEETTFTRDFTISKRPVTATVSVDDLEVGDEIVPVISTDPEGYDGTEFTYEYKRADVADAVFSTTVPTAAGNYIIQATLPETDAYLGTTCTATFQISKKEASATVAVADIYVGETPNPVITTVSDGKDLATFEYKVSTAADSTYSTTVPTAAGTYSVRATIPATDAYLTITCENTFMIKKITTTATVSVEDITIGGTVTPVVTTASDGKTEASFMYKLSTEPEDLYSDTIPTAAGIYTVMAIVPETATYESISCTSEFTISKLSCTVEVTADNTIAEAAPEVEISTLSDGKDNAVFEYKKMGFGDETYTESIPSEKGIYVLRVTIPETDKYLSCSGTCEFCVNDKPLVSISVDDIYYGERPDPEITVNEDKAYTLNVPFARKETTIEYKLSSEPDSAYSKTVPTAIGTYDVKATCVFKRDLTTVTTHANTTFSIMKLPVEATVTVPDIAVGGSIEPEITVETINYDGDIDAAIFEYKLSTAEDDAYSTTAPTAAGEYTVRAMIPETDTYLSTTCTDTFTISKLTTNAEVHLTIPELYVGDTPSPYVMTISNGMSRTSYMYKPSTADNTEYSETVPTAAGTYTVKAIIPETDTYQEITCETTFTIEKHSIIAEVAVEDIYVGEEINPVVRTNSERYSETNFTYEYKNADITDAAFSTTVPTAAGNYILKVTLPETDVFLGTTCEATFTISKIHCSVTVTANEINAGEEPDLDIETNSDALDQAIYEYREYSEPDTAFAEGYPTEAGLYVIRVTIPETDKYLSGSDTCEMQVNRNDVIATISVADIYVGETPDPVITSDSPAKNDATIEYKLASADDSAYSTTVPTAAGTYSVRASLPFTVFYKATTCETTFTISKRDVSASVSVADIVYGGTVTPVVTFTSEDYEAADQVTYLYAPHDIENPAEFTGDIPTEVGEYSVMAILPETDTYYGTEVFAIFNINRQQLNATVSVEDVFYGEEFTVNFTIQGSTTFLPNEYYYFEYKPADAADSAYTTTRPTATGNYVVRLTVLPNSYTEDGVATGTFAIKKLTTTASVTVANIFVGGTVAPVVTTASDGKDDTMFEYKLSTAADTAYSTTVPTAAGTYTVRATVPATLIYNSTTATAAFTISKNPVTATVTVADTTVGNDPAPVVTTVSDGVATYEYKVAGADDSTYTDAIPTAAGTYTVKATVPETAKYLATTATANFTISKNETTATVSVANITVGNDPEPIVITVSDGKYLATFQYKAADADDSAYSNTVPTAAGSYTVKASIPETAKYFATTATATFTISKNVATSSVDVEDILVGGTIYADVTTNSDGAQTVEYKAADADDSAYSTTLPYVEGKYTVRVTIPETAKYFATSCTSDFFISKNETDASVSVESIYVGGNVVPVISTDSNGKEDTTYEYKVAGADDSTYTATVPSAAGKYTVRATVPATLEYTKIVCYNSFEIYLNPVTMQTFRVANYFVGQSPDVEFECSSNGDVTYEYKPKNANDIEYTTDAPTKPGIYTARASVAETYFYASATFITDFTVSYLNAPQTTFTPAGTEGKNGYFKSDVELTAPAGYLISATEDGVYTKSIPYTEDLDTFYLKRDDGATTSSIVITDKPKIDKDAPEFKPSAAVTTNAVMFTPSITIKVDDQNLKSLTVNGVPVDLTTITDNTLTLSPGMGVLEVNIVAEDIAGNVSKISFILKAEWLELGTIPADQLVPLDVETEYNLGTGKWQVIKGNPEDNTVKPEADPTIYNGELPVYVNENGDYTVTQVS